MKLITTATRMAPRLREGRRAVQLAALQRSDGFVDLFKLRMGEAGVLVCQLGWCQESFRDGGEIYFFFWLACPCLEGGLLGDPCRNGASLFCLYYWHSYSDWAAAELGSLGWELQVRRCVFFPERKMYLLSLLHFRCIEWLQNGFVLSHGPFV